MFYDLFCELCQKKGVSPTRATVEIGLSRTIGTKWKTTGATPQGETLSKIADYFGVSVDYLLGNEPKEKATAKSDGISKEDAMVALFGGRGEVSKAMWEEAENYIDFIIERERKKSESGGQPPKAGGG